MVSFDPTFFKFRNALLDFILSAQVNNKGGLSIYWATNGGIANAPGSPTARKINIDDTLLQTISLLQ
jgi:hypothetical protein